MGKYHLLQKEPAIGKVGKRASERVYNKVSLSQVNNWLLLAALDGSLWQGVILGKA
jgi:hypothetical protein